MQTSEIPSPAVHPLDSNGDLIRLIADVSGESDVTVIRRLLDEERCIGTNVRNDLRASDVKLGRYVNAIHSPVAQFMAKTDVAWGNDLARRLASNRGDQLSDPERTC